MQNQLKKPEEAVVLVSRNAGKTRPYSLNPRPADCVKDRLCGYFYWNGLQSLERAIMVAEAREKKWTWRS